MNRSKRRTLLQGLCVTLVLAAGSTGIADAKIAINKISLNKITLNGEVLTQGENPFVGLNRRAIAR